MTATVLEPDATRNILDDGLPDWDASRVERRIIDASMARVYEAVLRVDFMDAVRQHRAVRVLFALRTAMERGITALRRKPWVEPVPRPRLRLVDLPRRGQWILLGADPPREIAFGVVGRFWEGETRWITIDHAEFGRFDRPGFAKIGCHLLLHPLPDGRTSLSYEARTKGTDPASRRAFLRYWWVASPFIGVVMRSLLTVVARDVARSTRGGS